MRCAHCGKELNPNGAWYLGPDEVCELCYHCDGEPPNKNAIAGLLIGAPVGFAMWVGIFWALSLVVNWVAK